MRESRPPCKEVATPLKFESEIRDSEYLDVCMSFALVFQSMGSHPDLKLILNRHIFVRCRLQLICDHFNLEHFSTSTCFDRLTQV
jgi:hypothetical protein